MPTIALPELEKLSAFVYILNNTHKTISA